MGQKFICPAVVVSAPDPIVPDVIGTWSYHTVSTRMVAILRNVVVTLELDGPSLADQIGAFGNESVELVQSEVEQLLESLYHNKCLQRLTGEAEDVNSWNTVLLEESDEGMPPQWHSGKWLYVECYMYRRLYDILDTSGVLQDYDYFHAQKADSFYGSMSAVEDMGAFLVENVANTDALSSNDTRTLFAQLMMASLWGNKCDMSLSGGLNVSMNESPMNRLPALAQYMVVDHHNRIFAYLEGLKRRRQGLRIDFILDNAGFELFADFCLADFIHTVGYTQHIVFHVKAIPWFVSDATKEDVTWMLEKMGLSKNSETLPSLAQRWQRYLSLGIWEITTSHFWTSPFGYEYMRKESKELYWTLRESNLLIFKGDLNYRKLMGDRPWPLETGFCRALNKFRPAPIIALRILKADIAVGISQRRAKEVAAEDPHWMTSGNFGMIQFCRKVATFDRK